jgi:hypothetical protein
MEEEKVDLDYPMKYYLTSKYPQVASAMAVNPNLKPGELAYLSDLNKKYSKDIYLKALDN